MRKILACVALASLVSGQVFAADDKTASPSGFKPSRDVEWVVTSSPGGGSDIYTRIISDIMTKGNMAGGKTILVTNKTDGGGEVDA